jgi:hypothetical protein
LFRVFQEQTIDRRRNKAERQQKEENKLEQRTWSSFTYIFHRSPFAPKKTFSGKLAIASASRNKRSDDTPQTESPQSVTQNKVAHCAARRCCATGVQISPTHTDPTTLVGGVSSFPSPLRLSHIPRLISLPGDGLTRTHLSKFPFSFTLSSSRGCRPILHTHHSIWTLHSHAICCPILRSEPSISTNYFQSSIRTLQFPPSIQAYVPIQTLDTCTHPSIWTLQFPSNVKRPRFNLDPPVQAISFAHASIRALQYPIRILAVFCFGGGEISLRRDQNKSRIYYYY